jgi:hypothetical protein
VEDRWRPKSDSGVDEPGAEADEGPEAIAQYGRGRYDEATGLYEYYEGIPKEVTGAPSEAVGWPQILEHWDLLEADFRSEYTIDLWSWSGSWRQFSTFTRGLLAADTRLSRALRPEGDADGQRGADDSGFDQGDAEA